MYELYPYFTNDGTVGLFSPSEDDIYHSTFGALTESWEKFIIPSRLEQYVAEHDDVKILDLCYGIGYNTKTALQVFIKSCLENEKIKNKLLKKSKKNNKNSNNFIEPHQNLASIDTDNNFQKENTKYINNSDKIKNNCTDSPTCYCAIDTDNISANKEDVSEHEIFENELNMEDKLRRHILIDAVDIDKILINLSPFITKGINDTKIFEKYLWQKYFDKNLKDSSNSKLAQIRKIKKTNIIPIPSKFKLLDEVLIVLFLKLVKNNSGAFNEPILQMLLSQKKYSPFFSKFMLNFARFCSNHGYNYVKNLNNTSFLHNIYYRYVSTSYKNAIDLLKKYKISINFNQNDAREFIRTTNNKYNFIFLDAFTPAKCPSLWSVEFFRKLYKHLEEDGVLLTYSNSAAVRNALLINGFCVGKIYDNKLKRFIGTIASKDSELIEYALDENDLALISSKAGICYRDEYLNSDNKTIIMNREIEVEKCNLEQSSKVLKGKKNAKAKSL